MALSNFSLPFGALVPPVQPWGVTLAPNIHAAHQLAKNTNNLLYAPADHQQQVEDEVPPPVGSDFYKNNPYAPPQLHQSQAQQKQQIKQVFQFGTNIHSNNNNNNNNNDRRKNANAYLPPITPPSARNTQYYHHQQQQQQQHHQQQQQHFSQQQQLTYNINTNNNNNNNNELYKSSSASTSASASAASLSSTETRTYGEGTYSRFSNTASKNSAAPTVTQHQQRQQYYNSGSTYNLAQKQQQQEAQTHQPAATYGVSTINAAGGQSANDETAAGIDNNYPERPPGFTRVQAGQGSRTQVHAVLDYDADEGEEDEYYDAEDHGEHVNADGSNKSAMPTVTPIQGPIFLKNGTVPVVPLFSYPSINNGTFIQIPIWWTALSVALGLDVRGDVIKGVPCIKRYHQLFCPTAGNSYPIDKIERFIDDNKALMRRMYGDFEMNLEPGGPQQTKKRRRRFIDEPDLFIPPGAHPAFHDDDNYLQPHTEEAGESYFGKLRNKRQTMGNTNRNRKDQSIPITASNTPKDTGSTTGRVDACESKVEIVTPYWASNSAGKIRAIVNTQHFEQAIHQEVCSKSQTSRCERDCGCEQKYKWHRLLAYDPDNDCKGIFMDWFLFPSCCVCRCNP